MRAAAIQMCSGEDLAANLATASRLVGDAVRAGAELVVLPEDFALLSRDGARKLPHAERLDGPPGPVRAHMAELARRTGVWLVLGGMPEVSPDARRSFNTSVVLDDSGAVRARYRKLHLFDVAIPGGVEHRESDAVAPGDRMVLAASPWGPLGLSICYDLRFPELFAAQQRAGARLLVLSAAFSRHTGRAHWHVLLRARAIENRCPVLAAAQTGGAPGEECFGHSLALDHEGDVLGELPAGEGFVLADYVLEPAADGPPSSGVDVGVDVAAGAGGAGLRAGSGQFISRPTST